MRALTDEAIKRWTAQWKSPLVFAVLHGQTTLAETSRAYDLPPSL